MSYQIIAGPSGCGKSRQIYEELIEKAIQNPKRKYLVLVPEQFGLQTQKEIVGLHPNHALLNIDVLGFNRLAYRVFEEVGGNTMPLLEESGKSLILQKLIREKKEELTVLKGTMEKHGAVEQLKSLLSELMQYRVDPDLLEEWIEEEGSTLLGDKLRDVQVLYRSFLSYLESRYLTTEEVPEVLCRVIDRSDMLRGAEVVLDGFTGFTPMQEMILGHLLSLCQKVSVVVTMDPKDSRKKLSAPYHLFHMSGEMIRITTQLARKKQVPIEPVRWIEKHERSRFARNEPMNFLEMNLFRSAGKVFDRKQEAIRIFETDSREDEVRFAAETISRLVRQKGYRYRDFALITGDPDSYGYLISEIFEEMGIPLFLDKKYPVLTNPMVEFIRSAVDMVTKSFHYAGVFRFLRNGLSDFSFEEVDAMENYVLATGIRGWKQYREGWTRIPRYFDKEKAEEELAGLNRLRERFVEEVSEFVDGMRKRNATVFHKAQVLQDFLEKEKIYSKMQSLAEYCRDRGELAKEKEYLQIYELTIGLLDKSVEILGEEKIGMEAWQQMLDAGLQEMRMGLLPPGIDQVVAGDMERSRLKDIKILFFIGVNEGVIPRKASSGGILSEVDREKLAKADKELSPGVQDEMYRQRFYLYLNMTKPSERLYLSYCRKGGTDTAKSPSYLIGVVQKLFPQLEIVRPFDLAGVFPESSTSKEKVLLRGLRDPENYLQQAEWTEVLNWYRKDEKGRGLIEKLLEAAEGPEPESSIGKAAARALYGSVLQGSASRLENYAACAFAHFLRYGMQIKEREEYRISYADLGSIMHAALERFSMGLKSEKRDWGQLEDEEREERVDRALLEAAGGDEKGILSASAGNAWLLQRVRRLLQLTVWALQEQLRAGSFRAERFEIPFSSLYPLEEEGELLRLTGKIDRVDLCRTEDMTYVKVVDYKTGAKELNLTEFYNGLQLQLVIYLNEAVRNPRIHTENVSEPAGIFYYKIDDIYVGRDEQSAEESILKGLRPDGLLRSEGEIIPLFDRGLLPSETSLVAPVKLKKNGEPDARSSSTYEMDSFRSLQRYADKLIRKMGCEILQGNVAVSPCKTDKSSSCDYCPYGGICGFDTRLPAFAYRKIEKRDNKDILQMIREEQ